MSAPYYDDGQVQLWLGDCREQSAWLAAGVLVTDPPYGIGWRRGTNKAAGSRGHAGILNDQDATARDEMLDLWGDRPGVVFGAFAAPPPREIAAVARLSQGGRRWGGGFSDRVQA